MHLLRSQETQVCNAHARGCKSRRWKLACQHDPPLRRRPVAFLLQVKLPSAPCTPATKDAKRECEAHTFPNTEPRTARVNRATALAATPHVSAPSTLPAASKASAQGRHQHTILSLCDAGGGTTSISCFFCELLARAQPGAVSQNPYTQPLAPQCVASCRWSPPTTQLNMQRNSWESQNGWLVAHRLAPKPPCEPRWHKEGHACSRRAHSSRQLCTTALELT